MLTTPDPKSCVDQYKAMAPTPTPTLAPTPDYNSDKAWDNRWYQQSKEHQEEQAKKAMLWAEIPKEWSDILHAYYDMAQLASDYAPSPHDSDKIKDTIDTLERVKRSQNNTVEQEKIDKIIKQLNMDLLYFKIKHGK